MLDACVTQGAGLQGLSTQASPRLVVMASHDDRPSELPLLWSLCSAWSELGYFAVVLDATQSESANNPGLQQLLAPSSRPEDMPHEAMDTVWSIYPAAIGLHQLCAASQDRENTAPFEALEQLFQHYDVVVLYANAGVLAANLRSRGGIEILRQNGNDGIEYREARYTHRVALFFEVSADVRVNKGKENNSRLFLDLTQCAIELGGCPHQGVDMGDGPKVGILRGGGLGDGIQRLTRGVRHEMKMKVTL